MIASSQGRVEPKSCPVEPDSHQQVAKRVPRATSSPVVEHSGDRISIAELELQARVGVTEDERSRPQRIRLNVTVWPDHAFDQLNDEIEQTVNYAELCRACRELVEKRDWKLIETIASELASCLVREFPLTAAEIEVHKFVLPNTSHVAVIAKRERTR